MKKNMVSFLLFPIIFLPIIFFTTVHGADSNVEPPGQTSTPVPKNNSYKYIVDSGGLGSVKMCAVSTTTGALSGCIPTGTKFENPVDILFYKYPIDEANNIYKTLAYVPSVYPTNRINICTVSPVTGAFSDCTLVAPGSLSWPSALTIVNGYSYITNYLGGSNDVSRCQVTSSPPYLTSCGAFIAGTINPTDIKSYRGVSKDTIYVINYASIRKCDVSLPSSFPPSCQSASSYGFSTPLSMAISDDRAYVLNSGTNKVIKCTIQDDGTLVTCAPLNPSGPPFNFGCCSFVGITSDKSYAYVSNGSDNTVRVCTVNSDGTFGSCALTGSGPINTPKHIY